MRRRLIIFVLSICAIAAGIVCFATLNKPPEVTLRDGTTLTLISSSYGKSFFYAPDANPVKRSWQEIRMHLPHIKKPVSRFYQLAGTNDALIWFKHTADDKVQFWSPPWDVLKEDGSPRGSQPPWTGTVFQGNIHGTFGVVWKDCPTNLLTLTLTFYKKNTNTIEWSRYTDATFLGRIAIRNPAYQQ